MGSSLSNNKDRRDGVLIDALRGRRLDLPGGGDLYILGNPGASKSRFTPTGTNNTITLYTIGRSCLHESGREFLILKGSDGMIYGRESGIGLHVLAVSIRDMLCKVGLSQRDICCLDGMIADREIKSPSKLKARRMDNTLGRRRGISVDDAPRIRTSSENEYDVKKNDNKGHGVNLETMSCGAANCNRSRSVTELSFGSATVIGEEKCYNFNRMAKERRSDRYCAGQKVSSPANIKPRKSNYNFGQGYVSSQTTGNSSAPPRRKQYEIQNYHKVKRNSEEFNERGIDIGHSTESMCKRVHKSLIKTAQKKMPYTIQQGRDSDYSDDDKSVVESVMF